MKILVVLSCALAITTASYIAPYGVHLYPQHLPVIGPNGVPLEPPANVAARAQHAALFAEAQARNGDVALLAHGAIAYSGAYHVPVIGPHGVPIEPLANQIARAQNAAAHLEANARHHLGRKRRSLGYYAGSQHIPVIGPNGVPLEPAANIAARAAHAAAHAAAGHGAYIPALAYGAYPWNVAAHTYPALYPDGQPIETPEVQLTKAAHFAAHAEANARNAGAHAFVHGVPLDTPEVAAAKAAHFAAKAAATHGWY